MEDRTANSSSSDSGQALIIFAVVVLGLVAMMALALDGGNLYLHRRRMQNAADAATLAAAQVMVACSLEDGKKPAQGMTRSELTAALSETRALP